MDHYNQNNKDGTLMQIFQLLKDKYHSFNNDLIAVDNTYERQNRSMKRTVSALSKTTLTTTSIQQRHSWSHQSDDAAKYTSQLHHSKQKVEMLEDHDLKTVKCNIQLELKLEKIASKFEELVKDHYQKHGDEHREISAALQEISGCLKSHQICQHDKTEKLDRLCAEVNQLKDHMANLPNEIGMLINQMMYSEGMDFKQFAERLHLTETEIKGVVEQREDIERNRKLSTSDLFQLVLNTWMSKHGCPNVRDLYHCQAGVAYTESGKKLESCMEYLCSHMMDVNIVIPTLRSNHILTANMCEYILGAAVRCDRIRRLVDLLCTIEDGFNSLCVALTKTDQSHIADNLNIDSCPDVSNMQGTDAQQLTCPTPKLKVRSSSLPEDNLRSTSESDSDTVLSEIMRLLVDSGVQLPSSK